MPFPARLRGNIRSLRLLWKYLLFNNQPKQTNCELTCVLLGLSDGNQQILDLLTNHLLAVCYMYKLSCHRALSSFQESILTFAFQLRFLKG